MGTDCVLSDWSSWSECRGPCVGSRTLGARTRSRSVMRQAVRPHGQCLSELVERQPCSLSPCYSYSASIIDDKVECIRSDGLIVEHGKHPIFYVASVSLCMILEAN